MAPLNSGPCSAWEPVDCSDWPSSTDPVRDMALMAATEILWSRTRRRFGSCTLTLRPCREECWPESFANWMYGSWLPTYGGSSYGYPWPALMGGRWYNLGCGTCGDTCSCTTLEQVELPYPVSGIGEVKVDGDVIDPSDYRVDDWRFLVLLGGITVPYCNDLNLADTEVGTWSVTVSVGEPVPMLGRFAVGQLGLQIALGCVGSSTCTLPTGTLKSLSRQGVQQEFLQGAWLSGFTGMPAVQSFLETFNPQRAGVASIFDIDGNRARVVGT